MNEQEYIELQDLLTKLRVFLLKEISSPDLRTNRRDMDIKMIRSIDNLRKNAPCVISCEEVKK